MGWHFDAMRLTEGFITTKKSKHFCGATLKKFLRGVIAVSFLVKTYIEITMRV